MKLTLTAKENVSFIGFKLVKPLLEKWWDALKSVHPPQNPRAKFQMPPPPTEQLSVCGENPDRLLINQDCLHAHGSTAALSVGCNDNKVIHAIRKRKHRV